MIENILLEHSFCIFEARVTSDFREIGRRYCMDLVWREREREKEEREREKVKKNSE